MAKTRAIGWPARVLAVLELEEIPMTIDQLHADLTLRYGQAPLQTIHRGVYRMIEDGRLKVTGHELVPLLTDQFDDYRETVLVQIGGTDADRHSEIDLDLEQAVA